MNRAPIISVTPLRPRFEVTLDWEEEPAGEVLLYMKRIGERGEFAAYPPIQQQGSVFTFQLDDLTFVKSPGRYRGRLVIGALEVGSIDLQYENTIRIATVEK